MTRPTKATAANIHSTAQYGDFTRVLDDLWDHWSRADHAAEQRGYYSETHNDRADARWDMYQSYKARIKMILERDEELKAESRRVDVVPVLELEPA